MARKAKPTRKRIPLSVKRRSRLKNKADALDGFIAAAGKVLVTSPLRVVRLGC